MSAAASRCGEEYATGAFFDILFVLTHPQYWRDDMTDQSKQIPKESKADRLSRFIVAVMTCLGALGLIALLYFPLHYLR